MNRRINNLRRKRKRKRIIFKRIRACLVLLIFVLILNKIVINVLGLREVSNENLSLVKTLTINNVDDRITVILDPGHGGYDIGANFEEIYEKDIVLNISNKVGEILEKNNINVIYTRTNDVSLGDDAKEDLKNRVDISNNSNAKYFISFHINDYDIYTYGHEEVYGFEIWTNFNDTNSLRLGKNIEDALESLNYTQKRPMLDGSHELYIIRENNVPSVLIEFGFMNNYGDRMYLSNEYNQKFLATLIVESIIESINNYII